MHIVLIILLILVCAYAIGLVLINNSEVAVNLMFSDVPTMNLGLLLVITITLGLVLGMLLALVVFRVLQNKWEISRLKKEQKALQAQLVEANTKLAQSEQIQKAQQEALDRKVEPVVVIENPNSNHIA